MPAGCWQLLILRLVYAAVGLRVVSSGQKQLAFDIGMNRGDDTLRYLQAGFKVIAVEANPVWVQRNSKIFKDAIANGSLVILNHAIEPSTTHGNITFYIPSWRDWVFDAAKWADNLSFVRSLPMDWGSSVQSDLPGDEANDSGKFYTFARHFDESASLNSHTCDICGFLSPICTCERKVVPSISCAEMINRYGVPHYLKVDIEGFDAYCMNSLAALPCSKLPAYITFEEQSVHANHVAGTTSIIQNMSPRGYSWKVTRQLYAKHGEFGAPDWGEGADDYLHGKTWTDSESILKQTGLHCWTDNSIRVKYDCDVHGKFDAAHCESGSKT
eukprot:gnl/TRDRNA2_/TRDRNA2_136592_c0_seq1.p1 gnl/TRDRNA2_/TRDRNA2_136592_c0~~gnl/TRDRNA2_/TRDRNA2_136592_c0_seq1.p1  ORF type:complete len:328 (+),score=36.69 gnl/TRDRNA2_/TRDRNA2_136592_c0_seq1:52-1035(+)